MPKPEPQTADDGFDEWMSGYKWGFVCGVIGVLICVAIVAAVAHA